MDNSHGLRAPQRHPTSAPTRALARQKREHSASQAHNHASSRDPAQVRRTRPLAPDQRLSEQLSLPCARAAIRVPLAPLPPWTSSTTGRCSSADASIAARIQKTCFRSSRRTALRAASRTRPTKPGTCFARGERFTAEGINLFVAALKDARADGWRSEVDTAVGHQIARVIEIAGVDPCGSIFPA
jgi:hypothetical protein